MALTTLFPSGTEVKERIELYLYIPSGHSWLEGDLFFNFYIKSNTLQEDVIVLTSLYRHDCFLCDAGAVAEEKVVGLNLILGHDKYLAVSEIWIIIYCKLKQCFFVLCKT